MLIFHFYKFGVFELISYIWNHQIFFCMADISSMIQEMLIQFRSIDIAESEFKRIINDDESLKTEFKEWCEEMGYRERHAFEQYCHEYLDNHESMFDTLSEYDE